ncbi:hypothetical protein KBZ19_12535 [Synechococcus sp. L2F]|uniref:hypothetical protein n=1 Tax=Synechococcus sp. L2F TaxID=2823739 RepID=UPI0020CF9953|nr:hypothetical protein [Synechococcus sp. L2F]MCP9829312.1 hypothetical protein [Synechococcus sp. L2F]
MSQIVDFAAPGQARAFWGELDVDGLLQAQPAGRRYLGALQIDQKTAEILLDIAAANFSRLRPFTTNACTQVFDNVDRQRYWCRLTTIALSEFAYHRSAKKAFWKELSARLNIDESQAMRNCFYDILRKGFTSLGAVQAHDHAEVRRLYVATLYLQNGIPVQHQERFATLLSELRDDYGWWEIAHSSPAAISELLHHDCSHRHDAWGTILRFLSLSCPKDGEDCQPISGELTQSLAMIATELDRRGLDARMLVDETQRSSLLAGFDIPNAFFLRDWSSIAQLLRFNPTPSTGRRIRSMQRRPLTLRLEPEERGEIQLVLPPQHIYRAEWKNRSTSFCCIPEAEGAEFDIDTAQGILDLDREITTPVLAIEELWRWQLRMGAGEGEVAFEWNCCGVDPTSPILIFDPINGERLEPSTDLGSARELVVFTPRDYLLADHPDVEVLERIRWCSIKGWWGHHLEKNSEAVQLSFRSGDTSFSLDWSGQTLRVPELRGERIHNRQLIFSSAPQLWIPPLEHDLDVHVRVDDLDRRVCLTAEADLIPLDADSNWQCIDLSDCIQQTARVAVVVWLEQEHPFLPRRWEQVAQVDLEAMAIDPLTLPSPSLLRLHSEKNKEWPFNPELQPLVLEEATEFWLPAWRLKGLWPFETITIHLRSSEASLSVDQVASARGELEIEMATFRYSLAESDHYEFYLQRQGDPDLHLICGLGQPEAESIAWDSSDGILDGLRPGTTYQLEVWNLLNSNQSPESVDLVAASESIDVNLEDFLVEPAGLYYLELRKDSRHLRTLGWWSGIKDKLALFPDGIDLELLGNLLDNEPLEAFKGSFSSHPHALSDRMLARAVDALADPQALPSWIDRKLLRNKLDVWLHPEGPVDDTPQQPDGDCPKEQPIKITLQLEPVPFRPWSRRSRLEATRYFIHSFQKVRESMGIPSDGIRIEALDTDIWVVLAKVFLREDLSQILVKAGEEHALRIKQVETGKRLQALAFHVKFTPSQEHSSSRRAQSEEFLEIMNDCRNEMNVSPDSIRFSIDEETALPVITVSHKEHKEKLDEMRAEAESELSVGITLIRKRE